MLFLIRIDSIIFEISFSLHASSHALSSLGVLHASFFAGLVIYRMFFDFLDNSFLLNFSLESLKCTLERFAFLNDDKCQKKSPPYKMMCEFIEFPG